MKKLLAVAAIVSMAGTASAASVMFDYGTNFYRPTTSGYTVQNGQNFTLSWALDNDLSLGVYNELSNWTNITGVTVTNGTLAVSTIQVAKGVVKNVAVGLNLGAGTTTGGGVGIPGTAPLADVFGVVNILTGSGEKVSGALRATAAARFCKANLLAANNPVDGYNVGLSVQIGF